MKNKSVFAVIAAVIVLVVGIGAFLGMSSGETDASGQTGTLSTSSGAAQEISAGDYRGQLIAGSTTPYLRYNLADFEKAKSEGKAIYLYYYATWCPICNAERPSILSAFDELETDEAVGFEVHFNDGQNNQEDNNIAREYSVFSQHTHVFIDKSGNVAHKTLTPMSKDEIKDRVIEATRV